MVSIVIPTYNEAASIQETLRRAAASLRKSGAEFELIVVDDSSGDGTAELAEALAGELPVRVLRRPGRLGLATAVLHGWGKARGGFLGVIDADLQHPPEVLADLVAALGSQKVGLAVATRYVPGGGTSGWSWVRRFISWAGGRLAATVLPWTLDGVHDSGSGMFLVRKEALEGVQLNPVGYKTLLEVLARGRYRQIAEVPYVFEKRERGRSKLGARQYLEYLLHLGRLARATGELGRWARYGLVGLAGGIVNVAALFLLSRRSGWPLAVALPVAIQAALLSNVIWNETFTFRAARASGPRDGVLYRLLRYEWVCLPGALLNALVTLLVLYRGARVPVAAALGVVAGGAFNLLFNIPAIWRTWGGRAAGSSS
jgi:dolichol-phosphate mannosyltransferase